MTQRRMARPSLGGLVASRQGALILGVLCAVCAAGILVFALGRYKSSVQTVPQQATVLVATTDIQKGTSGDEIAAQKLYKSMPIVASQLAPGAISDSAQLPGKVAALSILPGQQLTAADFTSVVGVTGLLTPNQRALSLSITEAPGNADVLQPGDRVDIYAEFGASGGVVLLLPNALILKPASGAAPSSSSGSASSGSASSSSSATTPAASSAPAISGSSLVLSVSAQDAPRVIYAELNGTLYLSLRPANGTTSPRPLTTLSSVLASSVATVNSPNGAHP